MLLKNVLAPWCPVSLEYTLQPTAAHRNTLQHTVTRCNTQHCTATHRSTLQLPTWRCNTLQHTATHCNTHCNTRTIHRRASTRTSNVPELQTAAQCNILQRTVKYCNALQHTATYCQILLRTAMHCITLQHTATHCNTLQHTATHSNTLQHTATHCNALHHTASHCSTLQHTATHCNTRTTHRRAGAMVRNVPHIHRRIIRFAFLAGRIRLSIRKLFCATGGPEYWEQTPLLHLIPRHCVAGAPLRYTRGILHASKDIQCLCNTQY